MRKQRPFRPVLNDELERRTVPSGLGLIGGIGGGSPIGIIGSGGGGPVGTAPSVDAAKVTLDFRTFENAYLTAVYNDLIAPGTPNTAKFASDPAIAAAFTALSSSVTTDTANLASNNPTLAATLTADVSSLQTTLNGLTPPATKSAIKPFETLVFTDINTSLTQAAKQVSSATPPTGTISQQTFAAISSQIGMAIQTFNTSVLAAAQSALPSNGGTPSTFAPAVQAAANTFTSSVTSALGNTSVALPPSLVSSLTSKLSGDIAAIQASLLKITIPTSSSSLGTRLFEWQVAVSLGSGEAGMFQHLLASVRTYNGSLS
jgi:hypothetical protein